MRLWADEEEEEEQEEEAEDETWSGAWCRMGDRTSG
jgi:hypothetical protein